MSKGRVKKAKGGATERESEVGEPKVKNVPYDAQGSAAEKEAEDERDGFKHGGYRKPKAKKRKSGGKAEGRSARARADKPRRAAGGRAPHSPLSAAASPRMRPGLDSSGAPSSAQDD